MRDGYNTFSLSLSLSTMELLAAGGEVAVTTVRCGDAVGPSLANTASASAAALETVVPWRDGVDGSLVGRSEVSASSCVAVRCALLTWRTDWARALNSP